MEIDHHHHDPGGYYDHTHANVIYSNQSNNSTIMNIVGIPKSIWSFYKRLCNTFGYRFVAMVAIVYGINQGTGESFFEVAGEYFLTDSPPKGLGLQPTEKTAIDGFSNIPWQVKSLYGIVSDTYAIGGFHRSPYIAFASAVGILSWSLMWVSPIVTGGIAAILIFFGNFSVASPDVMIDASVAERCKTHPRLASDLQTLCWTSFGIGKLFAGAIVGYMYDTLGSRLLYGITALTSLATLWPTVRGWLMEVPRPPSQEHSTRAGALKLVDAFRDPVSGPLYTLSVILLVLSMTMGIGANVLGNGVQVFCLAIVVTILVTIFIFRFERPISTRLAKASAYIFLSQAIQPSSPLLFYWIRENKDNCSGDYDRPCFSPEFLSVVTTVGNLIFVIGTSLYNKYFSTWSYRRIWVSTQIAMALVATLDFVLVTRINKTLGISDHFFVIGSEIAQDLVGRLNTMPLFVLAAATCPDGVEATMFAMNMGISNFGGTMSGYYGIGLMSFLGGVKSPQFENIEWFIFIRSIAKLAPILLVPFLCPSGSPSEEGTDEEMFEEVPSMDEDVDSPVSPIPRVY